MKQFVAPEVSDIQEQIKKGYMRIIIPMAGMGTRLRPQTLITPKPLIPIAGKSIVQRLIEELVTSVSDPIEEIAFIIGDFGKEVEDNLKNITAELGIVSSIYYQTEALGTAHAIHCARESLKDNVIVAFADTLFKADFKVNKAEDGIIWVKKVDDPSAFGVVKFGSDNIITDFVEKPKDFVSDLAIIGIYYFKDGSNLKKEIDYIIDNDIRVGKEFQLTTVLENMKNKSVKFKTGEVNLWLDCGNKDATVNTNSEILNFLSDNEKRGNNVEINDSVIIQPCYLGNNIKITNSIIGPYVSIESGATINNCIVKKSIIQNNSSLNGVSIDNSMVGKFADYISNPKELNVGDYTIIKE